MKRISWLGAGVVLVIGFATVFVVAQQLQRNQGDWPQVQIAEDAAYSLWHGAKVTSLSQLQPQVDINHSLAPFLIIYDKRGTVVAGSGNIGGVVPTIPYGVLVSSQGKPYHRVTWQPTGDVRIAAVSVAAGKYYAVSGRSLTEVEKGVSQSLELSAAGLAASLVVLVGCYRLSRR